MDPRTEHLLQSRRQFLLAGSSGIGAVALAAMLASDGVSAAASDDRSTARPNPLDPRPPHFAPRAKRCIFFFFAGGVSQLDLFDPKPMLNELDGQPLPESLTRDVRFAFLQKNSAVLLGTRRRFTRYGTSGLEFCDLLPNVGRRADDVAMIRSMRTSQFNHHPAQTMMNTGAARMGRPSIGSWLTYGLGSEAENLPGYVVLQPAGHAGGGETNWSSGFLPTTFAGVPWDIEGRGLSALENPRGLTPAAHRRVLDALAALNERRYRHMRDSAIASRIAAYELAFRMQAAAPELVDLSGESRQTHDEYGTERTSFAERSFATSCLLARRMVERGVRFVNVYMSGWDQHTDLARELPKNCRAVDQPLAALIADLKRRDLLDETLVVWGTEFGRTPLGENRTGRDRVAGRDHHPLAFTMWMAGGGVKGGTCLGRTDDVGWNVVEDPVDINDLHATLLHLFGLDHERLTYRHQGRDFRLTDVGGTVVEKILA